MGTGQSLHRHLCEKGAAWLAKSCRVKFPIVAHEFYSAAELERPDVIGFNSLHSLLIEVKTSRRDFLADAKKPIRIHPELGIGDFRFYLCPSGLITPEDLPPRWGLLWYDGRSIEIIVDVLDTGNYISSGNPNRFEKHVMNERRIMYSLLRRQKQGK